jgi:hypothetical protein
MVGFIVSFGLLVGEVVIALCFTASLGSETVRCFGLDRCFGLAQHFITGLFGRIINRCF